MVYEEPLLKELHIRLVTPERPGYGLSTDQPRRTILDWPDDVAALADSLGITRFAVLGVSGGGAYAAACAYKLPERVTALGLISSVAPPEAVKGQVAWKRHSVSKWVARYSPMLLLRLTAAVLAHLARRFPDEMVRSFRQAADAESATPDHVLPPIEREIITEPYRQGGRGHARDGRLANRPWGLPLRRIAVPTRLWHGKQDLLAPVAGGRYLAATIPSCQATYYPNERHLLMSAHAREILTALLAASGADASGPSEPEGAG